MTMDWFFYHGQNDLVEEIGNEINLIAIQPKRSLFYNRDYGAGAVQYENSPNTLLQHVGLRYDIVSSVSLMNARVSNGEGGLPDRRAAVSQGTVSVWGNSDGEMNVEILYLPLVDAKKYGTVRLPIGVL